MKKEVKQAVLLRIGSVCLLVVAIGFVLYSSVNALYESALNYIDCGRYEEAANILLMLPPYKDSEALAEYTQNQYAFNTEKEKLISHTVRKPEQLEFDTKYQSQIDALYNSIREEQKNAYEQEKRETFGGKLPFDGMNKNDLQYTILGEPDTVRIDEGWSTYATYEWYTDDGELLAQCTAVIDGAHADNEIFGFEYYGDETP